MLTSHSNRYSSCPRNVRSPCMPLAWKFPWVTKSPMSWGGGHSRFIVQRLQNEGVEHTHSYANVCMDTLICLAHGTLKVRFFNKSRLLSHEGRC